MSTALILLSDFRKTEIELWRPIVEAPDYEISNLGHVRSYRGKRGLGGYRGFESIRLTFPRLMKPTIKKGYQTVSLQTTSGEKTFFVHGLVANTFLSKPADCDQVNHKTGLKADNRLGNIEWSNHSRNHEHATLNRLRPSGERHGMAILTEAEVREMRRLFAEGMSNKELALHFRMSHYATWEVTAYRTWKYIE